MTHVRAKPRQCSQCVEVELRVDLRGFGMPVAQYLSDLFERSAVAEHSASQGVTQEMRPFERRVDARSRQRPPHYVANGHRGAETSVRSLNANEQATRTARWSPVPQIRHQSVPDLLGQRQLLASLGLAGHSHKTLPPIDVVEGHGRGFSRAQPQPYQQQQDGMVPPTRDRIRVTALLRNSRRMLL